MVSIELLVDQLPRWKNGTDLLDFQAPVQLVINNTPLPEAYYPKGLEVQLYETAFELLDLLENIINSVVDEAATTRAGPFQAEFCYTSTYLIVEPAAEGTVKVSLRFNPVVIDDEHLLEGTGYQEEIPTVRLLAELLHFPIAVHDALLEFDPALEGALESLQRTILEHQERLEKEIGAFPQDDDA